MAKATIFINGVIGEDTTLTGVISQFKAFEEPTELDVIINSNGGYVTAGEDIYNYLDALEIPVTTIAAKAYSIAATIFMAGDTRLVEDVEKPLMIHMPLVQGVNGNSKTLTAVANELEKLEKKFVSFYTALIDIPKDTIEALLNNETFLSADEAVSLGFATAKKETVKAVAFYEAPDKSKSTMSKLKETVKALALELGIIKETPAPVALVLQDATGADVDFYELEDGDTPAVDDKARVAGVDADGDIVMPSGETYKFEAGVLKEIVPAAETEDEPAPEPTEEEAAAAAAAAAQAEMVKEVLKWEIEINESAIEEGTQLTYSYDDNTYNLGSGEFELADGRRAVTDAGGIVVKIKPAGTEDDAEPVPTEDEEAEAILAQVLAKLNEKNTALEAQVLALKNAIGSADVDQDKKPKPVAEMTPLEKYRNSKL